MSNQPYRYDPQANVLRLRAEMKKPKAWNYRVRHTASDGGHAAHQLQLLKYEQHLASLPAYTPVSGWVPEVGKEYVLNEHFSVKRLNPQFREDETYEEYLKCFEEGYRFQPYTKEYFTLYRDAKVAVPIEQKQAEGFSVKDMEIVERDLASVRKGAIIDKSKLYGVPIFSVSELGDLLSDISQILRAYKMDDSWSDWDESVLNRLTSLQMKILDNNYVDRSYTQSEVIQIANAAYDAGCGDVNGTEKEKYFKSLGI